MGCLGVAYKSLGEIRRAIDFFEQALAIHRETGDRRGEGQDLCGLGIAYARLGETRRAIEFYEQALAIAHEIGDRLNEGNALGNLGVAYAHLDETRRAIEFYEQQLVIVREIGDRRGEGHTLWNMSVALDKLGSVFKPSRTPKQPSRFSSKSKTRSPRKSAGYWPNGVLRRSESLKDVHARLRASPVP